MALSNTTSSRARYRQAQDSDVFRRIAEIIEKNLSTLNKQGVISARPGYKAVGGWLTKKPAIVVTVAMKAVSPSETMMLPVKLGGFPVDVREASAIEKLRAQSPQRYSELSTTGAHEATLPQFEGERDVSSGNAFDDQQVTTALEVRKAKPRVDYTAPDGFALTTIKEPMAILCHASPDDGWPELKKFLSQVQATLTVGIYDFTSAHILQSLTGALSSGRSLNLVLDHPPKNPTADQTDEETVSSLDKSLGDRFASVWALVRSSSKAPKWIYPSAYHIKVAVRDSSVFWLSSGNWNNSNQPDINPLQDPQGAAPVAINSDRDWHVIVEHKGLAKTYEAYLKHDFEVASQVEQAGTPSFESSAASLAEMVQSTGEDLGQLSVAATMTGKAPQQYFPPLRIPAKGTRKIEVQPVLTPDNYRELVLPLIQNAQRTFYMQTQYIHPSDNSADQDLADLITAVVELQRRGVDVRIILSQWQREGGWLDKLQTVGVDLNSVKIQNGVHNKGIVVDSQVVMLGSQNWSGEGVHTNRDASLIIRDEEAAQYYERIFQHDWVYMASQSGLS
jgi:hypothetical protein